MNRSTSNSNSNRSPSNSLPLRKAILAQLWPLCLHLIQQVQEVMVARVLEVPPVEVLAVQVK